MARVLVLAALIVGAVAADAAAQVVQRPARPYRGLFGGGPPTDPNRSRSEMTLTGSLLVGHDTWLSPGGTPSLGSEPQSGQTLTGEAALAYFRGRAQRSISLDARAETNGYSGINADATIGGSVGVTADTNLGRMTQLGASQSFGYEPTLVLGGPLSTGGGGEFPVAPPPDVSSGYLEQRSWSSNSSVNLNRRWTTRQTTQMVAEYARNTYLDDFGYDTRSRLANASHRWLFSRTSSVGAHYGYSDSDSEGGDGLAVPLTNQAIDVSYGYARRLSPSRQLSVEVGGGATHVSTLNALDLSDLAYWMPAGNGSISWDVGRSWAIRANYSREATVLQGVSLTSFAADTAGAAVSGLVNSRIETSLSATYANGRSGGADTSGRYETYTGSLQFRYAISRCCATAVHYDYYFYNFQDVVDLPSGFAPRFDRQAIRIGFTVWLPLFGRYTDGESSRSSRRN
jgi:hypothetical protein